MINTSGASLLPSANPLLPPRAKITTVLTHRALCSSIFLVLSFTPKQSYRVCSFGSGLFIQHSFVSFIHVVMCSCIFFNVYLFLRDRVSVGEGRKRHRIGSRLQALSCQRRTRSALELKNCEIMA